MGDLLYLIGERDLPREELKKVVVKSFGALSISVSDAHTI